MVQFHKLRECTIAAFNEELGIENSNMNDDFVVFCNQVTHYYTHYAAHDNGLSVSYVKNTLEEWRLQKYGADFDVNIEEYFRDRYGE